MAKKLYVGVDGGGTGESYVTNYIEGTGLNTGLVANTYYTSYTGFEIDFIHRGGYGSATSYRVILNAGGTGNNTRFNFYARSGAFQIEVLVNGTKRTITPTVALTIGTRYKISNIVNATTKDAHFKVVNVDTGTTVYENTAYYNPGTETASNKPITIFNVIGIARASYEDIYSVKFYNLETLIENLIPINVSDGEGGYYGSFYDTISETTLSYVYDTLPKAEYVSGGVGPIAKEASKIYVGVNGEAKEAIKAYVGVNGEAKLFYDTTS